MDKLIKIDLQFFGEKTEEATPKKRQDTRKKGNVLQSKELTGAATLIVAVYSVQIFGGRILDNLSKAMYYFIELAYKNSSISNIEAYLLMLKALTFTVIDVLYILIPTFFTAFIVQRMQVGTLFTTEPLQPKLDRLNPISGLKRMFSMQAVMNLVKSLLKIILVGYVGYIYLVNNLPLVLKSYKLTSQKFSYMMGYLSINMATRMAFVIFLLGVFDYIYQRYSYNKNIKMSKQEVKEEMKQSEGDPQIKSKIKQKQREAAMRRMMQELPKADVIITNPTHFAVALKYDEEKYDAPYVVAKGQDYIAQKIKEKAKSFDIPIIENKPLARALYAQVDINQMITPKLYEAVAEVLAYVMNLKKAKR